MKNELDIFEEFGIDRATEEAKINAFTKKVASFIKAAGSDEAAYDTGRRFVERGQKFALAMTDSPKKLGYITIAKVGDEELPTIVMSCALYGGVFDATSDTTKFVLYHELGHYFNGDLDGSNTGRSINKEKAADEFALAALGWRTTVSGIGRLLELTEALRFQAGILLDQDELVERWMAIIAKEVSK